MVNLIWFPNKNAYLVSTELHKKHEIRRLVNQKLNHLASSVSQCTVLLEHVEDQLSPQTRKCDRFARFFCGCNCKTSNICHQQTGFFTIRAR